MTFTLSSWDWGILLVYLAITFYLALPRKKVRDADEFFLAGRSMNWILVSLSLFATLFSAVSFLGVPAEAYKNGPLMLSRSFFYALFTPIAVWVFLRFFFESTRIFTAYEYLEQRFDVRSRMLGSFIFIVSRALYGAAALYATAQMILQFTGLSPFLSIVLVGLFVIIYTSIGGHKAVILTDAFQACVILIGLASIIFVALRLINFDLSAVFQYASEHQKLFNEVRTPEFYSFDPRVRFTFWILLLISITEPLQHYGTDQLVVQRFLATKDFRSACRAIWLKTIIAPIFMTSLFFIGLLLFYYYGNKESLPAHIIPDRVLPYFIVSKMPEPLPGLLAAAILAALMSTIAATINSLSTVFCIDFLQRLGKVEKEDPRLVSWGKSLTWLWGGVLILAALFLSALAASREHVMIFELVAVWNALWTVLLVVMLAGIFVKKVTASAAFYSLLIGTIVNLILPWKIYFFTSADHQISPFLIPFPGMGVTLLLLIVLSILTQKRHKSAP